MTWKNELDNPEHLKFLFVSHCHNSCIPGDIFSWEWRGMKARFLHKKSRIQDDDAVEAAVCLLEEIGGRLEQEQVSNEYTLAANSVADMIVIGEGGGVRQERIR